jgi:hypothetical protein
MKTRYAWNCMLAAALMLPLALSGCGGGSSGTGGETASATSGSPAAEAPKRSTTEAGVASATVMDGAGTAPAQTVAVFLDSLRRGDERAANAMLTTKARAEMNKTSYVLQPLGTPEGQYKIGRVGFPYEEKSVALVECIWSEPGTAQEPAASMDIVCELHHEDEGWRISGLGVTITGTEDALVLDFEDAISLQATIDAATGQVSASTMATDNSAFPANPSLPSFPDGTDTRGQIAMPPGNGAPVLR